MRWPRSEGVHLQEKSFSDRFTFRRCPFSELVAFMRYPRTEGVQLHVALDLSGQGETNNHMSHKNRKQIDRFFLLFARGYLSISFYL